MSGHESTPAHNYCALPLAVYASRPDQSRGRVHTEAESRHRSAFQRDRDRIIHSAAFRRLQYKTQVFVYHEGDHYRTRLTHTLEVAQVARTLARALTVHEDLAEAVALAHDLGHTPFAHIGEVVLNECMRPYGGFDHNDQSLRILTTLEHRYPGFEGLNLTWETLEGVVKHNGPVTGPLHEGVRDLQAQIDLGLFGHAGLEAQIAALADDIAYNNHDIEDGLRAGLFGIADMAAVPILEEALKDVTHRHSQGLDPAYIAAEAVRFVFGAMVDDVLTETRARLAALKPRTPDDIRSAGRPMVAFSDAMRRKVDDLRAFLFVRMYHHERVQGIRRDVEKMIPELFTAFTQDWKRLPEPWQMRIRNAGGAYKKAVCARIVADYIAGMTDRFAVREHERLFEISGRIG